MGLRKVKIDGVWQKTPEYRAWSHIKGRCFNQNDAAYKDYGGRGITMHEPWVKDFEKFLSHIGPRPHSALSIDRIDNSGNYEPGNIRWATVKEQMRNRRMDFVKNFKRNERGQFI